ncbi:MAG: carbohydrate kinase family protein, partial [Candidatus Hydromicrobium sp.]|nr:carbohydrate kinase family protein [Candidatus Hydromicrobium sp.]
IKLVCLTRGEDGSLLMDESDYYDHPGYKISVADTVGAGDAFTAAVVIRYLDGGTLEEMSSSANRLGSWVSSRTGPTPVLDKEIKRFLSK